MLRTTQLLLLSVNLLLQACVFISVLDLADGRSQLANSLSAGQSGYVKLKEEEKIRMQLFSQFHVMGIDLTVAPYPKLTQMHYELLDDAEKIPNQLVLLEVNKTQFDQLTVGKNIIEETDPIWQKTTTLWQINVDQTKEANVIAKRYKNRADKFYTLAKKHGIKMLDVTLVKKELNKYVIELDKIHNRFNKIIAYKKKNLIAVPEKQTEQSQSVKISSKLDQLEILAGEFSHAKTRTNELLSSFNKEVKDQDKLWTLPEMKASTIINDMELANADLNTIIDNLNTIK